ncbi:DUF3667 domain-containing protein [Hymenobacter sp. ASUV-10]|uniref:DUF3667 domain-containing protein n=1 Tax=Hymenobacter aranciens TaxID=3063996 RepID=A0ABT9BGP0_9BACT|nr:DUF3667 domain-containing protein [Hymenobacter sp. ASUV-10]MDO7876162.1 DUF3667 domain-containing protein [Hymenobacter sp. ASUV-10]
MHSPSDALPAACLNCEAALTGPFCAQCGQATSTRRFTWGYLLHEVLHSVWHVDKGVVYTIWEMLRRPGHTMRRYLAGQRVQLFKPLALVLLVAGIASFLILALHVEVLPEMPARTPAERHGLAVSQVAMKYLAWFTVATLPGFALLSWGLLRRLRYNFVEHFMANALMMATVMVLQMLFLPLLRYTQGTPQFGTVYVVENLLMPLYQAWAFTTLARGAYQLGGSLWRGILITALGLLLNVLVIGGLAELILRLTPH